jgi:hypothetical protein
VNITAVSVSGFEAPVTGAAPITAGDLSAGTATYSVQSLSWSPTVNGTFAGGVSYTATVVLKAAVNHAFTGTITPASDVGTPAAGNITGGTAENTLTFTVTFPATSTEGTIGSITIQFPLEDEPIGGFPEIAVTLYKTGTGPEYPASLTLTIPGSYSSYQWYVNTAPKGTGNSLILNAADYPLGQHSVSVVVMKGAVPYSREMTFTVAQ